MEAWSQLLEWLALPQFGLSTVLVVSFVSATLLPLGSEPAVFGLIQLNPELFWPAILVATVGNTLGGALSWWIGLGAHKVTDRVRGSKTESGTLEVGGQAVCGLLTTWGDGFFPATLDVDDSDRPLRCTVTFATEESLDAMREVNGM